MNTAVANGAANERRSGHDRRIGRWTTLRGLLFDRRRSRLRRDSDRRRIVLLDRYTETRLWLIALILVLSVADGLLTLFLLAHGAVEVNPCMAFFLRLGAPVFLAVKYLLTAMSVIVVVILNYAFLRYIRIYVRDLVKYFAGAFCAVICWELFLIVHYIL